MGIASRAAQARLHRSRWHQRGRPRHDELVLGDFPLLTLAQQVMRKYGRAVHYVGNHTNDSGTRLLFATSQPRSREASRGYDTASVRPKPTRGLLVLNVKLDDKAGHSLSQIDISQIFFIGYQPRHFLGEIIRELAAPAAFFAGAGPFQPEIHRDGLRILSPTVGGPIPKENFPKSVWSEIDLAHWERACKLSAELWAKRPADPDLMRVAACLDPNILADQPEVVRTFTASDDGLVISSILLAGLAWPRLKVSLPEFGRGVVGGIKKNLGRFADDPGIMSILHEQLATVYHSANQLNSAYGEYVEALRFEPDNRYVLKVASVVARSLGRAADEGKHLLRLLELETRKREQARIRKRLAELGISAPTEMTLAPPASHTPAPRANQATLRPPVLPPIPGGGVAEPPRSIAVPAPPPSAAPLPGTAAPSPTADVAEMPGAASVAALAKTIAREPPQDWRSLLTSVRPADVPAPEQYMQSVERPAERYIAVQVAALLSGKMLQLKNEGFALWTPPVPRRFTLPEGANKGPRGEFRSHIAVLRMLSPIIAMLHHAEFAVWEALKRRHTPADGPEPLQPRPWTSGILNDCGIGRWEARLTSEGFGSVLVPGLGDTLICDLGTRSVFFDELHYRDLPLSVLHYRLQTLTWAVLLDYFPIITLDIKEKLSVTIEHILSHLDKPIGMAKIRTFLGIQPGLGPKLVEHLERHADALRKHRAELCDPAVLMACRREIFKYLLRVLLAETLDLVGLIESVLGLEIRDRDFDPGELLDRSPHTRPLIEFASRLKL